MSEYNLKERIQAYGAGKVLNMIKSEPEKNIPA